MIKLDNQNIDIKNLPQQLMEEEKKRQANLDKDYEDIEVQKEVLKAFRFEKVKLMTHLRLVNTNIFTTKGIIDQGGLRLERQLEAEIKGLNSLINIVIKKIDELM